MGRSPFVCIWAMKILSGVAVLVSAIAISVATSGCYKTMDNRSKMGVPFSKDKMGGQYERPVDQVQAAARKVLQFNGTIIADDIINRVIVGKIDTRTVYVKLTELEPALTGVTVQARNKSGSADVDLAAEIDKQIALNLK
jgi:hypothetical protein